MWTVVSLVWTGVHWCVCYIGDSHVLKSCHLVFYLMDNMFNMTNKHAQVCVHTALAVIQVFLHL